MLAIEEDHTYDTPCDAVHCIVAIDVTTAEVKKIVTGADFYYSPVFSVDGTSLAWLEWNHPGLPFDAAKVHTANWDASGSVSDCRLISGDKCSSVTEPRWGYDGTLLFAQETGGYRQLFRVSPESHTPALLRLKGLEKAEFGVNRSAKAGYAC